MVVNIIKKKQRSQRVQTTASPTSLRSIIQTPVEAIKPYPRNNRIHTDKQVDLIARSIQEFGFINPVLVDENTNIVAGHGRYEAALRLGMCHVPTILLEHLNEAQVKAYRIADNRIAELSSWDDDKLRMEIIDLSSLDFTDDLGFDLSLTGFETAELDLILADPTDQTSNATNEILTLPAPGTLPVSRLGDLWLLGSHRILCGDALKPEDYTRLMDDEQARMVFMDPPYNVPIDGHVRVKSNTGHREFAMGAGEMSVDDFYDFLRQSISYSCDVIIDGGIIMVFMDWRHIEDLIAAGRAEALTLINLCVWNKTNGGMGSLYRSKHEMICIFKYGGGRHINNVELGRHGRNRTNVWDYAGVNTFRKGRAQDLADHPTVKPTALIQDAIMDVSHRTEIVLDPFGGSGSTLLAAEKTGRKARLIELDPLYVDVTIRRWQSLTGRQAVLQSTSEAFDLVERNRNETLDPSSSDNQEGSHDETK